jgi:soluble lytic murein transglycosylase-like protein
VLLIGASLSVPAAKAAPTAAPSSTTAIRAEIDRLAARYGVDTHLVRAVAWMESGYQQHVVSSVGAVGVMQLLPSTWEYVETVLIGRRIAHTADGNVRVGIAYLRHLLRSFGGNERLALAGWYQGEHSVRKRGPYAETGSFVANVLALRGRM